MDKITIIPGSVRGYGDVVSPKTLEDFTVFDSELSFEDGLYTLVYDASGVSVGLSVSASSITVGGSVVLTAEVLSAGEPASGETVSFYDGSTLLGTDETDSDGIATYTASSLGVGSHSLTAEALDKSSSAVSVTVNKLTSTITLSVPSTGTVGTSYTVSGTLVPTSGSVKLYENGVLKDTLTVTGGSFSKAITQSNEGTYSYYAVFEGSSTYSSVTSSTGSIVVSDVPPVPVVTSVSLTGDKSILSYYDSESATLSATVLDSNDDPMEGVTVTFYNGSTSMGTADTNSSGIATKSYASSGVGDVSFTASVGTISSETYTIEDCFYANLPEQTVANSTLTVYSAMATGFTNVATGNFQLEFEMLSISGYDGVLNFGAKTQYTPPSSADYRLSLGMDENKITFNNRTSSSSSTSQSSSRSRNTYYALKFVRQGNTVTAYSNNSSFATKTVSWLSNYSEYDLYFIGWTSANFKVKNIKLKKL